MAKYGIVVYGENLQTPITTKYEISVFGKVNTIIFIQNDCVNLLHYREEEINEYKTVLFSGDEIETVLRTTNTIVFVGDVEKIDFIDKNGSIVSTYRVNDCNTDHTFTELKR